MIIMSCNRCQNSTCDCLTIVRLPAYVPKIRDYKNTIVTDINTGKQWIFDSCGDYAMVAEGGPRGFTGPTGPQGATGAGHRGATGTNRYFYVDDVNVAYPAGVAIDLGNLDLWAEGLPVAPAIATVPSLGGVWDEPLSAHTIPGSMGKAQNDTNRNSGLIPATV